MKCPISEKIILEEYESYFPDGDEKFKQQFVKALAGLFNMAYALGVQDGTTQILQ